MKLNLSKLSLFQKTFGLLCLLVLALACSKLDEIPLEINKTQIKR